MNTTEARLTKAYGNPHQKEAFHARNIVYWKLPEWLRPHWPPFNGRPISTVQVNKAVIPHIEAVMRDLIALDLIDELTEWGGAYVYRMQRGSTVVSIHAFGCALDFNCTTNPLGGRVTFSAAFLAVWRAHGWTCGADFRGSRVDGMHFEYTKTA